MTVGSSAVLPSSSIPSSEVSETLLVWPGLFAVTFKLLLICPEFAADADIWNVALYLSISAMLSVPWAELFVEEMYVGPEVRLKLFPKPSVKVSLNPNPLIVTFPLFSIKISHPLKKTILIVWY